MADPSIKESLARARTLFPQLQGPLLVGVAYYMGAEAAFLIGTLSDKIFAPFWPPNAILFCALALLPYRQWPLYIVAALPAHVMAELSVGMGWLEMLVAFATNCMVAALNALGVRYLLGAPPWFDSLNKALVYVVITAFCSSGIAALGGAFVRITGGGDFGSYWHFWAQWYVANALASLTLAPVLLTWFANGNWEELEPQARRSEALVLLVGLAVACIAAFKIACFVKPGYVPAFVYLPLPFVIWGAVRFRTIGASASILLMTIVSIASALRGRTVFAGEDVEVCVLSLQLFLIVLSGSILLLGAAVDELRRAEQITGRLARSVLGAHDQERRQVARHALDETAQRLAAATWVADGQPVPAVLKETLEQSIQDLRKLSYLLHPPMLDEAGLEPALRARLDQYARCTGLDISLELTGLGRLPADVELTIFRVVEEALANVKHHSGSTVARIIIQRQPQSSGDRVVAVIEDDGRGMPWIARVGPAIQGLTATTTGWGLGLTRIRERVHRLGGSLEIRTPSTTTATVCRGAWA